MDKRTEKLLAFLDASPSVYHAAANIEAELKNAGYTRLNEGEMWELAPGGKYFVSRGGIFEFNTKHDTAFRIHGGLPKLFRIHLTQTFVTLNFVVLVTSYFV